MSSLFRPEALANKTDNLFGKAYLNIPISYSLFTYFLVLVTFVIIAMLYLGNYARKETVIGVLVPDKGLIRLSAPRGANVSALAVSANASIDVGSPLLTLTSQTQLTTGQNLTAQQINLLDDQIQSLTEQLENEHRLSQQNQLRQQTAISEDKSKIWQLSNQLTVSQKLVMLKQRQFKRSTKLAQEGYLTDSEKSDSYQQLLLQQQSHEDNKRQLMIQKSNLAQMKHNYKTLPLLLKQRLNLLRNQQSNLQSQLAQLRAQGAEQLTSPVKGRISTMLVHQGEQVSPGQLLMTIIPDGAKLEAELYLPSRASGFIKEGQQVRLRYQAFPYQRYGIFSGQVSNVSKAILSPGEFSASVSLTEAVYKVRVSLDKQSIVAFGGEHLLQPGMQLEADIVLDTMSLLDWLMMPIYAIKGKW